METIDKYRIKLKEIADLAFGYGIKTIEDKNIRIENPESWNEDIRENFLIACHDGFKKAQNLLIDEISKYQKLFRGSKAQLKKYRRNRNKPKETETKTKIKILEQRLSTLSHIADGIAWQLIGSQIHVARRLHLEQNTSKFLDSSNIKHAIKVANMINQNPLDFALISDLTSFVQIGDLLVRHEDKIGIMELKEGDVNDLINDFFNSISEKKEFARKEEFIKKLNKTTHKQMLRVLRQIERATRATEIINKDKGIDPVSGGNIKVSTPKIQTEYYHEELMELREKLKDKVWAYTVIDTCLHIGMYRDEGVAMAGFVIEQILKGTTKNYIIVDWLSITKNLSEPIFSKPFSPDFIIDILTGRVKIIIGLDLDALIETWNIFGLEARWMTKKETGQIKQTVKRQGFVEIHNRGIATKVPGEKEMVIYGGTISKIIYDNIRPVNIAMSWLSVTQNTKEKGDSNYDNT